MKKHYILMLAFLQPLRADSTKEVNAQKASDARLYMVDEGEYSESWQNASSYFKNAVDENQLEKDFFLPFMVMS